MAQYSFGSGTLYGKSLNAGSQTPVRFGALQGATIEWAFTTKELFGSYQFPLAIGRGTAKITGKADFAQFTAKTFNDLFFGAGSVSTGATRAVVQEAQTITANSVTVAHAANFVADLGIVYAANGGVLVAVANNPVGGQYTNNASAGTYAFNNSINNSAVLVSYTWADTVYGQKISITNQLLGNAPTFSAVFEESFQGNMMTVTLNACMSSKLSLVTKLEDFTIPSFDFECFADASNNIGTISLEQ